MSSREVIEMKIRKVVSFIREDNLEVPFIGQYKKEIIRPDIDGSDLWSIYQLDEKFCRMYERKKHLLRLFQNMQAYQAILLDQGIESL